MLGDGAFVTNAVRLAVLYVLGKRVGDSKPRRRDLRELSRHVALSTLAEVQNENAVGLQTFARLSENRFVNPETALLSLVDKRQRLALEIGRFPTTKPETHPVC